MTELLFDKLAYMDRLQRAGIAEPAARAHAEAMEEALRESVATKADIAALRADISAVRTEIAMAVRDMTIRTGAIAMALFAALASISRC
jgi:predicted secreted Zn-dependent protease